MKILILKNDAIDAVVGQNKYFLSCFALREDFHSHIFIEFWS